MARAKGINTVIRHYVKGLEAENIRLRAALTEISCPTQTENLLWWQHIAHTALHPTTEEKED